jgi:hypothetical protein
MFIPPFTKIRQLSHKPTARDRLATQWLCKPFLANYGNHAESHQAISSNRNGLYSYGELASSIIGLQTFIKTGESSLIKLVPLRSTLNTRTLSFPSKFVRSVTLHLPTGVCLFSLLPATGWYYLLHFLPSTISYSTARGQVKSLLTVKQQSLPLNPRVYVTQCCGHVMFPAPDRQRRRTRVTTCSSYIILLALVSIVAFLKKQTFVMHFWNSK